jgi:hypothetical protein
VNALLYNADSYFTAEMQTLRKRWRRRILNYKAKQQRNQTKSQNEYQ